MKFLLPVVGIVSLALVGCGRGGSSGGGGGNTLAIVNGDTIGKDEYYRYLENKPSVRVVTGDGQIASAQVAETLGFQALQDMIQRRLVLQMAKDEGVLPTDQDLEKEVDFQKQLNPQFVQNLSKQGLTLDDIRESLRIDLARERLLTKNITVTMEDVDKYIKENPKVFTTPATADCLYLFVKTDDRKAQVDTELAKGQAFAAVAQQLSQAPSQDGSNRYPVRVLAQMPGQFRAAIQKAAASQQTEWIKMNDGWVKFFVQNKTDEKMEKMDDIKKKNVQRQLAIQKGSQAREIDKTLLTKFKEAKVDIKYDPLQPLYAEFEKKLKEEEGAKPKK